MLFVSMSHMRHVRALTVTLMVREGAFKALGVGCWLAVGCACVELWQQQQQLHCIAMGCLRLFPFIQL